MTTHLEPDILECDVKWVLGSITMHKVSGTDRIPDALFQILKVMLLKCCTQYASKFGKLRRGHRTGKVSFHSSPKEEQYQNVQTTTQLHLLHASKVMFKIL